MPNIYDKRLSIKTLYVYAKEVIKRLAGGSLKSLSGLEEEAREALVPRRGKSEQVAFHA